MLKEGDKITDGVVTGKLYYPEYANKKDKYMGFIEYQGEEYLVAVKNRLLPGWSKETYIIVYGVYEISAIEYGDPVLIQLYKDKKDAQKTAASLTESISGQYYTYIVRELEVL